MPSFLKGKSEPKSSQGRKDIEKDQRVVTFLDDNHPVKGFVRYIGEDKDHRGNPCTYVGLELVSNLYVHVFCNQQLYIIV